MSIVFPISEPAFRDVFLVPVAFEVKEVHEAILVLALGIDDLKK